MLKVRPVETRGLFRASLERKTVPLKGVDKLKAICLAHRSTLATCPDSPSKVMVEYKLERLQVRIEALRNLIESGYHKGVIDKLSINIAQDLNHIEKALSRTVKRSVEPLSQDSSQISEGIDFLRINRPDLNNYYQNTVGELVVKINSAMAKLAASANRDEDVLALGINELRRGGKAPCKTFDFLALTIKEFEARVNSKEIHSRGNSLARTLQKLANRLQLQNR